MPSIQEQLRQHNHMVTEIDALYHEAAVKAGISDSVQHVLYILHEHDNRCPQSEIYKQCGISRQTINSAIRRLEQDGIAYLAQGKGRSTIVCLTERGVAFAQEKIEPLCRIENEIFGEWTEAEVQLYLKLTERYRDALRAKLEHI